MKVFLLSLAVLLLSIASKAESPVQNINTTDSAKLFLMPVPTKVTVLVGKFRVKRDMKFWLNAPSDLAE